MKRKLNCLKYTLHHIRDKEYIDLSNILSKDEKFISFKLLKENKLLIYNLSVNIDQIYKYLNITVIKVCKLLRIACKQIIDRYKFPEDIENLIMSYCMINYNDFSKIIKELNNFRNIK